jgi:hypothetical protein
MFPGERRILSLNVPVLRESLYQPRPLSYADKAFLPLSVLTLTQTKWSQQIANAQAVYRSVEEQATQNCWFECECLLTPSAGGVTRLGVQLWGWSGRS